MIVCSHGVFMRIKEGQKTLLPADFLFDDLIVKRTYYSKRISDHLPMGIN